MPLSAAANLILENFTPTQNNYKNMITYFLRSRTLRAARLQCYVTGGPYIPLFNKTLM